MKNRILVESTHNVLALLAGILLTLASAPFGIFPFAILSAAILLVLWLNVSPQRAFIRGFFYGIGLFGSGVYWIYISIHTYGNLPAIAAAFVTCLFIALLALFPATQGYVLNRYFPNTNTTKILCAFPALWVFWEWVRSWIFSGFPWLFIGYSQTHSPLKGFAPIFSVYGVSLTAVLSGALVVNAIINIRQHQMKIGYYNLLLLTFIWLLGGALNLISWTKPEGQAIQVSLVQANIPQELKWAPEHVEPTLKQYQDLTEEHWDSQVIIWPEAAIPVPLNDAMNFVDQMAYKAKQHKTTLITGIPVKALENDTYFNAVISVGDNNGFYLKHRLVPFGEYIPFSRWMGRVFDFLNIPMSNLVADYKLSKPLVIHHGIKILTFICYEIAFPEQVLTRAKDIGLLLTVTNDAWFGHSIAQSQHLQMAEMRAIETGRPILFATNNGITALISEHGNILSAAPPYKTYVLTGKIQPYTGKTPWQYFAMDPILIILISLIVIAVKYRGTHGRTISST